MILYCKTVLGIRTSDISQRILIREAKKHADPADPVPDPDPQHCRKPFHSFSSLVSCKQVLTRWVYRPAKGRCCCPSPPLGCPPGGCPPPSPLREAARARCADRPCCCRPPPRATFQESLKMAAIQCSKLVPYESGILG